VKNALILFLFDFVSFLLVQGCYPFIQSNLGSDDWRRRDAAVMAFGSILEGPAEDAVRSLTTEVCCRECLSSPTLYLVNVGVRPFSSL
jgi:hypothetical protein